MKRKKKRRDKNCFRLPMKEPLVENSITFHQLIYVDTKQNTLDSLEVSDSCTISF